MAEETILIDTQLLVLLVVGLASRDYIGKHKNLNGPTGYSVGDFELLLGIVSRASRLLVTPHVLAETSNLVRQGNKSALDHMMMTFKGLLDDAYEQHVPGKVAAHGPSFVSLGLTDAALLEAARPGAILLTADFDLYRTALEAGRRVENFNHRRAAAR